MTTISPLPSVLSLSPFLLRISRGHVVSEQTAVSERKKELTEAMNQHRRRRRRRRRQWQSARAKGERRGEERPICSPVVLLRPLSRGFVCVVHWLFSAPVCRCRCFGIGDGDLQSNHSLFFFLWHYHRQHMLSSSVWQCYFISHHFCLLLITAN